VLGIYITIQKEKSRKQLRLNDRTAPGSYYVLFILQTGFSRGGVCADALFFCAFCVGMADSLNDRGDRGVKSKDISVPEEAPWFHLGTN